MGTPSDEIRTRNEMQNATGIVITALLLAILVGTSLRRSLRGRPPIAISGYVAKAVLRDSLILAFVVWGILFAVEVPPAATHWIVFAAIVVMVADGGIREHRFRRGGRATETPHDPEDASASEGMTRQSLRQSPKRTP